MSIDKFHERVMAVLGAAPPHIEPGRLHRFSTNGKRHDTSGYCKFFEDGLGGFIGCFRSNISETYFATDKSAMTPAERAALARQVAQAVRERELQQQKKYRANGAYIADIMATSVPVSAGDPVARYLAHRGMAGAWDFAPCLRLHPGLTYMHEGTRLGVLPAMVAPLVSRDGALVAVHRTYLTDDGQKAEVPTVKKLTPACGSLRGAAIRLQPPRTGVLGVAEGIETALAASIASGVPVWSTYCANGLASFHWPSGVRRLIVFADADDAGREAAAALRVRAIKIGLSISIMVPETEGADWADVVQGSTQ